MKGLFGTPDSHDFRDVVSNVDDTRFTIDSLNNETQELKNVTKLMLHDHQVQLDILTENGRIIKKELNHLLQKVGSLQDLWSDLYWMMQIDFIPDNAREIILVLTKQQSQLRELLTTRTLERTNSKLLNTELLHEALNEVASQIPPEVQLFFDDSETIWDIYKFTPATVLFTNSSATIILKLPLADKSNKFELTEAIALSLPKFKENTAHGNVVQYDLEGQYLITNSELFAILAHNTYKNCLTAHGRFCTNVNLFHTMENRGSCLFAHYLASSALVKMHCRLKVQSLKFPHVVDLNQNYWWIITPVKINLIITCTDKTYSQTLLAPFQMVKLHPGCIAFSEKFKIFGKSGSVGNIGKTLAIFANTVPDYVALDRFDIFIHKNEKIIRREITYLLKKYRDPTKRNLHVFSVPAGTKLLGKGQYTDETYAYGLSDSTQNWVPSKLIASILGFLSLLLITAACCCA